MTPFIQSLHSMSGVSSKAMSRRSYQASKSKASKEQKQSELGKFVSNWRESCFVGYRIVNPSKILHNPKEWGRELNHSHVCDLRDALFVDDTEPQTGEVVVFNTTKEECQELLEKNSLKEFYARKQYYLSGNHTADAMKAISEIVPNVPKWRRHTCKVYATPTEQTHPDTLRALRGESDLQNKKHDVINMAGFKEYFPKMV